MLRSGDRGSPPGGSAVSVALCGSPFKSPSFCSASPWFLFVVAVRESYIDPGQARGCFLGYSSIPSIPMCAPAPCRLERMLAAPGLALLEFSPSRFELTPLILPDYLIIFWLLGLVFFVVVWCI